jgi:hypothetical protein
VLAPELAPETHPVSTVQEWDSALALVLALALAPAPALALALAPRLMTEHPEEGMVVTGSLFCSKL